MCDICMDDSKTLAWNEKNKKKKKSRKNKKKKKKKQKSCGNEMAEEERLRW